jgi:hypothetical protein
MKRELNKWQYGFELRKCPPWQCGFRPYVRLWFLKFTSFPDEGEIFSKEHYRGIYLDWTFSRSAVVTLRTFRVLPKIRVLLHRIGIKTYEVYVLPAWLSFW